MFVQIDSIEDKTIKMNEKKNRKEEERTKKENNQYHS